MRFEKLFIGTTNPGKMREFSNKLKEFNLPIEFFGEDAPETHYTFIENAIEKAKFYSEKTDHPVVSDDSGLIVDHLVGLRGFDLPIPLPGVFSMRFCDLSLEYDINGDLWIDQEDEQNLTYEDRNQANRTRLLKIIKHWAVEFREAHFVCAMVVAQKGEILWHCERDVVGSITHNEHGNNGFGYDPIFVPAGSSSSRTFAQLPISEKQEIDHRSQCLEQLKHWLIRK